jgi:hypothetical protein
MGETKMDQHVAANLLHRFLFWQSATQVDPAATSRFRGFVEACALILSIAPQGGEAQDALAVFERLRALAGKPVLALDVRP